MEMQNEALSALYDQLESLRAAGNDEKAKTLLIEKLQDLPEALRDRIAFEMFTGSLREEVSGLEARKRILDEAAQMLAAMGKKKAVS